MPTTSTLRARQTRRPVGTSEASGAGLTVDRFGGPAIDPTENVLSIMDAESRYRDTLRAADAKYNDDMRLAGERHQKALREQAEKYELRIATMESAATVNNSSLLATQLSGIEKTLGDRITDLEKKSWETGGKSSVADPALAKIIEQLTATVSSLSKSDTASGARVSGRGDVVAWVAVFLSMAATVASIGSAAAILLRAH